MRAIILADASFAARERSMLSRLEIGLVDEGVRVLHALPRRSRDWVEATLHSVPVLYDDGGLTLSRSWRARALLRQVEEAGEGQTSEPGVVHVFGRDAWWLGFELAGLTGAALALEVWRADLAAAVARLRPPGTGTIACFVPDPALKRAIEQHGSGPAVRLTPWGVHAPALHRPPPGAATPVSILLAGPGRDAAAVGACLEGLAPLALRDERVLLFADADLIRASRTWPLLRRLGILDRFTLVPSVEARRELALRSDMLVLPEALGEHRSLTLDALASGTLVVAAADPLVGHLIDHRTCRTVDRPRADRWSEVVRSLLDNPDAGRTLAQSAFEHVRTHHRASGHVAAVVDAYEWMTSAGTLPFPAATA